MSCCWRWVWQNFSASSSVVQTQSVTLMIECVHGSTVHKGMRMVLVVDWRWILCVRSRNRYTPGLVLHSTMIFTLICFVVSESWHTEGRNRLPLASKHHHQLGARLHPVDPWVCPTAPGWVCQVYTFRKQVSPSSGELVGFGHIVFLVGSTMMLAIRDIGIDTQMSSNTSLGS